MTDISELYPNLIWYGHASDVGMKKESTLALRISNKLRFGLDMLCRRHNVQLTELVENLLWDGINDFESDHGLEILTFVEEIIEQPDGSGETIPVPDEMYNLLNMVWHEDEPVRIVNLSLFTPQLLNMKERKLMDVIRKDKQFWLGEITYINKETEKEGIVTFTDNQPNIPLIRHNWEAIIKKTNGERVKFDFDAKPKNDDLPEYPSVEDRVKLLAQLS